MKAIILGGVAAGMSAASKLKRMCPQAEVVVYERGSFLSYGACGLPYYISGQNTDFSRMVVRTPQQFQEMGISTFLRHEALRVDPLGARVQIKDHDTGRLFWDSYDKLMIAVGCNSAAPRVPGANMPSAFYLKTMEDGLLLQKICTLDSVHKVAVIGGGYIGVEMTEALLRLGKQVTLIEAADRLLLPFEPEFSELAALELEKKGVQLCLGERVQAFTEEGTHRLVHTQKGAHAADILLVATGLVPATDFLKDTGLTMAKNGALLVDRQQRTNLPNIYAAGDCSVCWHRLAQEYYFLPLGTVANKCGRIAGGNMAGEHQEFEGALGTAAIQVCDLQMARTGLSETDATRLGLSFATKTVVTEDHAPYYPGASKLTIKLIYEKPSLRLLGANIAGAKDAVLRADVFATAIHAGLRTDQLGSVDLAYAPPFASVWDAVHIAANAAK